MNAPMERKADGRPPSEAEFSAHPLAFTIDAVTRVVRLMTWLAMYFTVCTALWILTKHAARAAGPQEDPRAAALAVGRAGSLAAGELVRDADTARDVPGFAGTDVPERSIAESDLKNAGRARLNEPGDAGGAAGRALIRARNLRPDPPDLENDPGLRRAQAIQAAPRRASYRADGLATGGTTECAAEVEDAVRGGTCGGVSWCVGADCGSAPAQGNTGFVRAASSLNMVLEMGGTEFDRQNMEVFPGERRACNVRYGGLRDCCDDSGVFTELAHCPVPEMALAQARDEGRTHYLGEACARRVLGVCVRRERSWCVFGSKLGLLLHEQARPWLGIGWHTCRGFGLDEIEHIDFDRVDLSDFVRELNDPARDPGVILPERGAVRDGMRDRLRDLAEGQP